MNHCIMSCDPGLHGAVAFYFPMAPDRISVHDMPVVDGSVNGALLSELVGQMQPTEAIIEQQGARPNNGVRQAFKMGIGYGMLFGVLASKQVPVRLVSPQMWKRHFGLSKDKSKSRAVAIQRFPVVAGSFARVKDDGRAEAALIALWRAEKAGYLSSVETVG